MKAQIKPNLAQWPVKQQPFPTCSSSSAAPMCMGWIASSFPMQKPGQHHVAAKTALMHCPALAPSTSKVNNIKRQVPMQLPTHVQLTWHVFLPHAAFTTSPCCPAVGSREYASFCSIKGWQKGVNRDGKKKKGEDWLFSRVNKRQ